MKIPAFYPILDTTLYTTLSTRLEPAQDEIPTLAAVATLLDCGARILQLRHKAPFTRGVTAMAAEIGELCRQAGAIYIINDRADIAAALGAGIHVGQDDLAPAEARRIAGPDAVLGFSTHNAAQLAQPGTEPADYLAVGPIFATGSKVNPDPVVGLAALRELRAITSKPLVAIGGISLENAGAVLGTGVDSVAVIGGLFAGCTTTASLASRTRLWMAATR